jgi:hypothetical protein
MALLSRPLDHDSCKSTTVSIRDIFFLLSPPFFFALLIFSRLHVSLSSYFFPSFLPHIPSFSLFTALWFPLLFLFVNPSPPYLLAPPLQILLQIYFPHLYHLNLPLFYTFCQVLRVHAFIRLSPKFIYCTTYATFLGSPTIFPVSSSIIRSVWSTCVPQNYWKVWWLHATLFNFFVFQIEA